MRRLRLGKLSSQETELASLGVGTFSGHHAISREKCGGEEGIHPAAEGGAEHLLRLTRDAPQLVNSWRKGRFFICERQKHLAQVLLLSLHAKPHLAYLDLNCFHSGNCQACEKQSLVELLLQVLRLSGFCNFCFLYSFVVCFSFYFFLLILFLAGIFQKSISDTVLRLAYLPDLCGISPLDGFSIIVYHVVVGYLFYLQILVWF